jgi:EmrB/QacA subfamily drug resistance transporter
MLVGKLSDIYGRKIFILIGIGIFSVGALLCGTSESIVQLILYRGIQGFGGGMIMSTAFTTIGDLFTPRERGKWQGLLGGVFGLSSLFGPTLGGYIVDNFAWNWIFWVFLPIGLFAFILILKLYPSHEKKESEPIDYLGSIVLASVIVSLLLGFSWAGNDYAWTSIQIIGLFSFSALAFIAFILIEQRVPSPVIPLHLFKNSVFTLSNIAGMFLGMGMFGVIMYTPFFVQGVLGHTATTSGLVEMVMTLAMVGCSAISGQLLTRTGKYKMIALVGLLVMATGLFLNSLLNSEASLTRFIIQLVVVGMGLGMTMPVFQVTVQNAVKHKYLGVATSTMQVFRQIGGTIGVAILGTVMGNLMSQRVDEMEIATTGAHPQFEQLQNPQLLMDQRQLEEIQQTIPADMASYFEQFVSLLREALSYSLTGVFLVSSIIVVLAFGVTFFIKEIPLRTTNNDEGKEKLQVKELKQKQSN